MLRNLLIMTLLMGVGAVHAATELDQDSALANFRALGKELPGTMVVRTAADGTIAVAHIKEALPANATTEQLKNFKFTQVEKGKQYASDKFAMNAVQELDSDRARESWLFWGWLWGWGVSRAWGGYYYPNYWHGGYAYNYAPYYYYPYGGYGYAYYRPCW